MSAEIHETRGCGNRPTAHSIIRTTTQRSKLGTRSQTPVNFYPFDAEYVRRLRAGEPEVQEHFTLYFWEILQMKLRRYRQDEAHDIIQETFVRALEKLRDGKLRQPDSLGAFVFGICKRICFEKDRERKMESFPENYSPPSTDNPEHDTLEAERARALRSAISEMSPKEQRLLKAYFFDEQSKDDICKEFGVTPGYLRVCLHRAKKSLKRRFLKKFDEKYKPNDEKKDH
jgi:RNA polymerase sigma-70 factor, ECF subfamily